MKNIVCRKNVTAKIINLRIQEKQIFFIRNFIPIKTVFLQYNQMETFTKK